MFHKIAKIYFFGLQTFMDIPYNILIESKTYKKAKYLFEIAINS